MDVTAPQCAPERCAFAEAEFPCRREIDTTGLTHKCSRAYVLIMKSKVPVSARALLQRINRKLAPDEERVMKSRGQQALLDLGEYYIVNINRNFVTGKDVDLEKLGREVGALTEWEELKK